MNDQPGKRRNQFKKLIPRMGLRTQILHRGEDPWVIYWHGSYYYCRDFDDRMIMVNKAKRLEDIGTESHVVWSDPSNSSDAEVWAPELHRIKGKWYIYFTKGKNERHRMYVLEGMSDDPQGEYVLKGQVTDSSNQWAIDGTVFEWQNLWYFVWSGWESEADKTQNLYIAGMVNPWKLGSERVCISQPEYAWEKVGAPLHQHINEGPQALGHDGKLFIIYSASHSLTDDYCLGQLTLVGDDPLIPASWKKKDQPVFSQSGTIFGPGHASFIEKPDGSDWIVYHSTSTSNAGWDARLLRTQRFSWNHDGSPAFGKPRLTHGLVVMEKFSSSLLRRKNS